MNEAIVVRILPWATDDVRRLVASARTLPGDIGGIPAKNWWSALILILVDTEVAVGKLLKVSRTSYDRGELAAGLFRYQLHPLCVEAISALLPHPYQRLFHWPDDRGRSAETLLRRLNEIVSRANLPDSTSNPFERLRVTARDATGVLDRIDFRLPFKPNFGHLSTVVPLDERSSGENLAAVNHVSERKAKPSKKKADRSTETDEQLYQITIDTPRKMLWFVNDSYVPQRLAGGNPDLPRQYRKVVEKLSYFQACDATLDHLEEDLIERFLAWLKMQGKLENVTINNHRTCLLAIWRHAWRKRKVPELPREISRLKISKRIPEAWSIDQVTVILRAAAEVKGNISGIPAHLFWMSLILILYCTGLRIRSLLKTKVSFLNFNTRWLTIPAEIQKQDADQVFRIPAQTMDVILATRPRGREMLFPWPYDKAGPLNTMYDHYRKILKTAGLNTGKRDLFHKLRRTSATAVAKEMGREAAKEHLGHSDSKVTARYLDPRLLSESETASERIPRLCAPGSEPQVSDF